MAKCIHNKFYKLLYGSIMVIALFIVQVFADKAVCMCKVFNYTP